jgi:hypothetical protein
MPLVHRDLVPWRGGDAAFDERLAAVSSLLAEPAATVVQSSKNRVVVSAPGSRNPHSVTIRNSFVGGRDGDGGQTIWLSVGRSIALRIENLNDPVAIDDLSTFSVRDVADRFARFRDLWSVRTAAAPHPDDVAPTGRAFEEMTALFDAALERVVSHVAAVCTVTGTTTRPLVQIVAGLDQKPQVVIKSDVAVIGRGHMARRHATDHPILSAALERLVDPDLRGCMIEHGSASMHLCFTPMVSRACVVQPADAMTALRHHADPAHAGIPMEFA